MRSVCVIYPWLHPVTMQSRKSLWCIWARGSMLWMRGGKSLRGLCAGVLQKRKKERKKEKKALQNKVWGVIQGCSLIVQICRAYPEWQVRRRTRSKLGHMDKRTGHSLNIWKCVINIWFFKIGFQSGANPLPLTDLPFTNRMKRPCRMELEEFIACPPVKISFPCRGAIIGHWSHSHWIKEREKKTLQTNFKKWH